MNLRRLRNLVTAFIRGVIKGGETSPVTLETGEELDPRTKTELIIQQETVEPVVIPKEPDPDEGYDLPYIPDDEEDNLDTVPADLEAIDYIDKDVRRPFVTYEEALNYKNEIPVPSRVVVDSQGYYRVEVLYSEVA